MRLTVPSESSAVRQITLFQHSPDLKLTYSSKRRGWTRGNLVGVEDTIGTTSFWSTLREENSNDERALVVQAASIDPHVNLDNFQMNHCL